MADLGSRPVVDAPPATPPRLSLLTAAPSVVDITDRSLAGFKYDPESCEAGSGRSAWGCAPMDRTFGDFTNPGVVDTVAWNVWAVDRCSTLSSPRDRAGRARRLLLACESKQVAEELWKGTLAQADGWPNRFLASPDTDIVTTTALDPVPALGCLERALQTCSCGGRGMIHASAEVVTAWDEKGLLRREGNLLLTVQDTIVVTDAGYDGSGPDGAPAVPGSVWAYATGLVFVRRGPIEIRGDDGTGVDRATNTWTVWAERMAAAAFDGCCALGAEIDVEICAVGS